MVNDERRRKSSSPPRKRISRRMLLRLTLGGGIAAGAAFIHKQTESVGFGHWFRWLVRGQAARLMPPTRVALAAVPSYDADLMQAIERVWREAALPHLGGARIVVKPNLVGSTEPAYTHPRVVIALVHFLRAEGAASVVVAEGMTFDRDTQVILEETGYATMLAREGIEFVDLNYDDLVRIPLRGGYTRMESLFLARTVAQADALISVPKLKTHHWTGISASVKNLFGIVPGIKYGWPKNTLHIKGITAFLAELLDSLPVPHRVAMVDGIVGMQGDGPLFGTAVPSGALVAGSDLVAVDATCARLMGFDPKQIDYLAFAAWAGIGTIDEGKIEIVGESLARLQRIYERPPQVG